MRKNPMNREALALLSKDELIDLVLSLAARLDELERRLGLNSTNSGKPPSSDGLSKPPAGKQKRRRTGSLREKSGRKPGGQKGHEGETLRQVAEPDAITDHYPETCPNCRFGIDAGDVHRPWRPPGFRSARAPAPGGHGASGASLPLRAMWQANQGRLSRWRHRPGAVWRADRGHGGLPVALPARLPEDRLAELMADLFAVALVPATVARMGRSRARRFEGVVEVIRDLVKSAPVKHMDETGLRVGGRTQWLHVASSAGLTFYRVSAGRGSLLDGVAGIVGARPLEAVLHDARRGPCAVQRPSPSRVASPDRDREGRLGAQDAKAAPPCLPRGKPRPGAGLALQPSLVEGFRRWWDAITAEGIRFHEAQPPLGPAPAEGQAKRRGRKPRRTGHNLLLRLQARKEDALRFLANLAVPFTNNQAEQDVRMAKLKQKISGGFRSEQGANDFATIRGFISTAKKQGWNIIPALMENPETLIARLRDA